MGPADVTPTREQLVELCDSAVVAEKRWTNRDSAGAQRQIGELRSLLLAGCEFTIEEAPRLGSWWVEVQYKGFDYFEEGTMSVGSFYVPTAERLAKSVEIITKDWY